MNKLIKASIVGGVVYAMCDLSFQLGKGEILGAIARTGLTGSQCVDIISDDKRWRVRIVKKIAEHYKSLES